jgi:hypothetical protein
MGSLIQEAAVIVREKALVIRKHPFMAVNAP